MKNQIDIVITWVDGNDLDWLKEKNKYVSKNDENNSSTGGSARYEDTNLLQYLFRGIEAYASWVNKIYFVTWGHLPKWLNTNNPKLKIVNHKDFIPKDYLPTFNSATINLNLHRIPGLSEQFIYFNDDMFILDKITPNMFFKNHLPCDMYVSDVVDTYFYHDNYNYTVINDLCLLNKMCRKKEFIKTNFLKVFNLKYGFKNNIKNLLLNKFNLFTGIIEPHLPAAYLKSSFVDVWNKLGNEFNEVCKSKIRDYYTCTENVIRYYQMATGSFVPINRMKFGCYTTSKCKATSKIIKERKFKIACINYIEKEDYQEIKDSFESILPNKSSYEI